MDREVFVLSTGELFDVWEIEYSGWRTHRESRPWSPGPGFLEYSVETADVSFSTHPAPLAVNQSGQLSQDDIFREVTVLAVEDRGDHLRVSASAMRRFDYQIPEP